MGLVKDGQGQRKVRNRALQQRPVVPVREQCAGSGEESDGSHRPTNSEPTHTQVSYVRRTAEERRFVEKFGDVGEFEIPVGAEKANYPCPLGVIGPRMLDV